MRLQFASGYLHSKRKTAYQTNGTLKTLQSVRAVPSNSAKTASNVQTQQLAILAIQGTLIKQKKIVDPAKINMEKNAKLATQKNV